ncbi:serine/threonine-protein kinase [Lacipirellula sp.]|uniref:serine/threonine-protein kinase n=1 Tax=Lacipirellula sp. TaxID=2691419 RepID=UPI003D113B32
MQIEQLGPYRIGRKIGKGGMGSVYEAVDEKSGQRVAVKALAPQLAMAEGFRERFEAEIESLKKLQHEGIVRLLGYGEHEGILFYSMELVDGPSLEQEINAGRRFDWNETLGIAVQICRALKHAHDHGVVHRDIKPANLLLTPDGKVKIADFGIARLFGSTQLTTAGGVLGTADYMSPEQADGRPITEKCDQYSLGCVMFALLAGRPPFRAKTMPEMLQLQRFAEPEPVRRFAPQTPEDLDRLIRQLLSKEPSERFPNVQVLGRHMEAMQRALSRPPKPQAPPAANGGKVNQTLSDTRLDATAVFNADATLAPEDMLLVPRDTTDSGVYNAPTLADEGQLELEQPVHSGSPLAPSISAPTGPKTVTPPKTSRFTTVDEEAERLRREEPSQLWPLMGQAAGILGALAALIMLGWWMTRPATADALYESIETYVDDNGDDDLKPIEKRIDEFLARFPNDSRVADLQPYADELELQRMERKLRFQSRRSGQGDAHPIAELFSEANALRETNPERAAAILQDTLTLYPTSGSAAAGLSEEMRQYLTLAERELAKLRTAIARQAKEQMPMLRNRLMAAERLEAKDPAQARAMYEALVDLYGAQAWASELIDEARKRMTALPAVNAASN